MKAVAEYIKRKYDCDPNVIGIIVVEKPDKSSPLIGGFDILFLIIVKKADKSDTIHYIKDNLHIQEKWMVESDLRELFIADEQRFMLNWVLQGDICLDREERLHQYRQMLLSFPDAYRERKLLVEFFDFMCSFLQCRHYMEEGNILDAYVNIHEALIHWARIVITEANIHSEVMVWNQVKKINVGVYKIYEELISSPESLDQRVKLVLLACEFSVMPKMKSCCELLLRIIGSRKRAWTVDELKSREELRTLPVDYSLLLRKLVERSFLQEVLVRTEDVEVSEIGYRLKSI